MPNAPRIAVISDIHGNLPALEAVLSDAARQGAAHFLVAGDIATRAPFPVETIHRLQSLDAHIILGNADQYQIDYARSGAEKDQPGRSVPMILWNHKRLGEAGISYLSSLPESRVVELPGMPPIRMEHASPGSLYTGLVPGRSNPAYPFFVRAELLKEGQEPTPLEESVTAVTESLLICGHTHIPWQEWVRGRLVLNPGAVGLPINADPRAQYALLDWRNGAWQVEPRAVAYDWLALKAAYQASGLLSEGGAFARACRDTALTGENVAWFMIRHALQISHQPRLTEEIIEAAAKSFNWAEYEE